MAMFGGIEAGGTKFVCIVGSGPDDIRRETRFPTTTPDETIQKAIDFFQEQGEPLAAVGIAAFGPLDPDLKSPDYGKITTTPKPGWAYADIGGRVSRALGIPLGFDTDVNGAALGEHRWGAARGLDTFVYFTIGTGIGGGGMVGGKLMHGLIHPEMGHIRIPHDLARDPYPGHCPFHGDCWEGLACGPAIESRWGVRGEKLAANHPAWDLEAEYLAQALVNVVCTLSPQRIILGGGVMDQEGLIENVRQKVQKLLNGYIKSAAVLENIDTYIVTPGLGNRAGGLGAIALAQAA